MPEVRTWKCKGCGKLKGEQNGWWWGGVVVHRVGEGDQDELVPVHQFRPLVGGVRFSGEDAYCGASCLLKAVSAYLDSAHSAHKEQSA